PDVMEAFAGADLILIGPGSLYTSIIPNLLVPGVAKAIAKSQAPRVYIGNLMTQPGETSGMTLSGHVRAIEQHTGKQFLDWAVLNDRPIGAEIVKRYRAKGAEPVGLDVPEVERMGIRCLSGDLLEAHSVIRHDSGRLAALVLERFILQNSPGK